MEGILVNKSVNKTDCSDQYQDCIESVMDDDNDFTFCQVGLPVDQDGLEAQKIMPNIGVITLKDEYVEGESGNQTSSFLWKDKLLNDATSRKQGTVGSLSFSVIDTSPVKNSSRELKQKEVEGAGDSVRDSQGQRIPTRKPPARAKVPFEKGHSQMDWLKLTRTHPDLAGLKGQSNRRLISMDEVKQHRSEGSMWTVLKGRVYNITPYMKFHPGGVDILMKAVGKDCTSLFNKYHAWVNAEFLLEKCLVGTLEDSG